MGYVTHLELLEHFAARAGVEIDVRELVPLHSPLRFHHPTAVFVCCLCLRRVPR